MAQNVLRIFHQQAAAVSFGVGDGAAVPLPEEGQRSLGHEGVDSGRLVLAGSRAVPADPEAGERAVRFALTRATESLEETLRIAVSRGMRIPCPLE